MAKHILVPYDGSETAKRAFESALELAKLYNGDITILTCISIHPHFDLVMSSAYLETLKLQKEDAIKTIAELEPRLKELKISYKTEVLEAISITDVLLSYAKSHQVDLIVMGSRGLGGFKKLLLGSVASGVSQHSECPVLIVK
ncbi:MAG TPA: universal stress protein [Candidatus Limnocylindrales bacterium]|nr:universal stress protein [Candidatus Limnocylindrales bacterium]